VEQYDALHVELESPGFPQRLRPAWGKLEAYLARFALILAIARVTELKLLGQHVSEQVTREDLEGADKLLAYFKNHARRVYTGLYGTNAADNLAADLRDFLITCGGQWEGSASELFEVFESEHKPDRDKDLGRAVRSIAKRSPLLSLADLPRKTTLRRFRLMLKNVGSVGSVGSDDDTAESAVIAVIADREGEDAKNGGGAGSVGGGAGSADIADKADAQEGEGRPSRDADEPAAEDAFGAGGEDAPETEGQPTPAKLRTKRRTTPEEAEKIQRLMTQGMKATIARAEVLGVDA
jgi:hypothetical protein